MKRTIVLGAGLLACVGQAFAAVSYSAPEHRLHLNDVGDGSVSAAYRTDAASPTSFQLSALSGPADVRDEPVAYARKLSQWTGASAPLIPGSGAAGKTSVPEPETYAFLMVGLGLAAAVSRRRRWRL